MDIASPIREQACHRNGKSYQCCQSPFIKLYSIKGDYLLYHKLSHRVGAHMCLPSAHMSMRIPDASSQLRLKYPDPT